MTRRGTERCTVLTLLALVSLSAAEVATRRWGAAPSGEPAPRPARPEARAPTCHVPEAKPAPAIDGRLDDAAWKGAPVCRLARTLDGSAPAAQTTEVRLCRDARTLYLAFRCVEAHMGALKAAGRGKDDSVWQDDSIEVFLSPGGAYYHFGVNAAGSTYDARGKDPAWDSGLRAAAGREKDAWTCELALPLAKLCGDAPSPVEWTANFNRNRYAAGSWQEFAWSPTGSGDSHVPGRFGKMLFGSPPPGEAATGERPVVRKRDVTVLPAEGAAGLVRFDLSDLPEGAKVYRADLRIYRTAPITGAMPEAQVDIDLRPAGGEKPLSLREPWRDRFDATEAVRAWSAGRRDGPLEFLVKACPLWRPEATCLDVAWEGPPVDVPPQAAAVAAFHRAGQTFLTWKEPAPLIAAGKATYGEVRRKLAAAADACEYRIYAHAEPITAGNLHAATCVGEAGPLSAWNLNARSKEYLIAQAMLEPDEMGELARDYNGTMHQWTMDHPRMDRFPVRRFVIDEAAGELPAGTGLYVHHPAAPGRRFYAVVSVRGGVENTRDLTAANAPRQAVEETVGPGEPVRQYEGLRGPYFDWPGTRWVYVQWAAPPFAPRPGMYFNWTVLVPPGLKGKAPCELYFHPEGYSYAQPGRKMMLGSVQIAPHDWPPSGWYGFHESFGTLGSFRRGRVEDHTQRRILAFLDWARRELPIDPKRLCAVGADGAALLALKRPELFACVFITRFDREGVLEPKAAGKFAAAWGPPSPAVRDADGRGEWGWAMLDERLAADPGGDLPLFVCRGPSWGHDKGWGKGRGRFYSAMHQAHQPLIAHWAWGGTLAVPDKFTGLWRGLELRSDAPVPALGSCSLDKEGEGGGNTNIGFSWRDAADAADRFEVTLAHDQPCTFDMTPRRLVRFKIRPGETLRWTAAPLPGRRPTDAKARAGTVAADGHGLVTLRGLEIARDGAALRVTLRRP
ncbi:MAG TPA: sugar-binding protein [Phycisphaerae bacterium]|nr:sugar-binding protein [Phycisphaerae bacterium]